MKELRCTKCGKLLLKASSEYEAGAALIQYDLEVQCTRCKAINRYKLNNNRDS
ncbi:hypothetical protein ACIQXG_10445 [Lysinibacillus sphaericus]|uniref:hypothetical protein n=1 Tax=Lysinibacillus sphaericus TaxID=1421 RepID=UPI00382CB1B0